MNKNLTNQSWSTSVFPIAAIFSFRMLGLFMLIPVFSVYALHLQGATPALIGIALGGYGLSQGLLQMVFGILSDRFGRKPLLTSGLILFALGSLIGALTHSIYGMIIARIIQGSGAIGSVLIALLADLTPQEQRTKAMAVIGATIGLSFSLAMVISPAISLYFGLSGIFYMTACLACFGLLLLYSLIPVPRKQIGASPKNTELLKAVLSNHTLQCLNIGIFIQHIILTATFFSIPLILEQQIQSGNLTKPWHFYLPLMLFSFLAMMPLIGIAERKQKNSLLFVSAILVTGLSQFLLAYLYQYWFMLCSFMFSYFVAFNLLEASLPAQVSKEANPNHKGTAMGVYSSSQFLGIFVGGAFAGFMYQIAGNSGIFFLNAFFSFAWFLMACLGIMGKT